MRKIVDIIFWGALFVFACYVIIALCSGAMRLLEYDWRTALIPIAALIILTASGYAKAILDLIKR